MFLHKNILSRTTARFLTTSTQIMLAALALIVGMSVLTQAQTLPGPQQPVPTTYVSSSGSDRNACDAPANACRTLTYALQQTFKGGEIIILDSGNYDPVRIDKGVSIIASTGVTALVKRYEQSQSSLMRIDVSPAHSVVLRGLTIMSDAAGAGVGLFVAQGGASVHIEDCSISGFSVGMAIYSASNVFIKDSVFRDNSAIGLDLGSVAHLNVSIDHSRFEKNTIAGIMGRGSDSSTPVLRFNISNSVIASNEYGITLATGSGASTDTNITNCIVTNNTNGITLSNATNAYLSSTTVVNNGKGLWNQGTGKFYSQGNNMVYGNLQDSSGAIQVVGGR